MNLIEISPVGIEIWGVEYGYLVVVVNNTLMCHTSFLAADTRPFGECLAIYTNGFKRMMASNRSLGFGIAPT